MNNKDKLVDYILKNVSKLSPEKITALGAVIKSLGLEVDKIANEVKEDKTEDQHFEENNPEDILNAQSIQIDDFPKQKVRIYKS